jgi:hypothetical protein
MTSKTDVWRLAYRAGWPALAVATGANSAWRTDGGQRGWETLLERAWPAVLDEMKDVLEGMT